MDFCSTMSRPGWTGYCGDSLEATLWPLGSVEGAFPDTVLVKTRLEDNSRSRACWCNGLGKQRSLVLWSRLWRFGQFGCLCIMAPSCWNGHPIQIVGQCRGSGVPQSSGRKQMFYHGNATKNRRLFSKSQPCQLCTFPGMDSWWEDYLSQQHIDPGESFLHLKVLTYLFQR